MVSQANNSQNTNAPTKVHPHHVRTFFAAIFGILALVLIFLSIMVVWLNQTLTNNQDFVNTLAPLASQSSIQNFISQKVSTDILNNTPTSNLADSLLPENEVQTSTTPQLKADLQPVISQSVLQVVESEEFYTLWKDTLQSSQSSFVSQLNGNASSINLNLHPTVVGVINQLQATNLQTVANKIQIQSNLGNVSIKGNIINKIRSGYKLFKKATIAIVLLTILFAGVCVWLSVHHFKTLRRIVLGMGIISLVLSLILETPSLLTSSTNSLQKKATLTIINTLFHNLRVITLIAGIVLIVLVIISKIYSQKHKQTKKPKTIATPAPAKKSDKLA